MRGKVCCERLDWSVEVEVVERDGVMLGCVVRGAIDYVCMAAGRMVLHGCWCRDLEYVRRGPCELRGRCRLDWVRPMHTRCN
jgi:hypothetical protein